MMLFDVTISSIERADHTAKIGYDWVFSTYVAKAFYYANGFGNPEKEWPEYWFGRTPKEFPTLQSLLDAMARHGLEVSGLSAEAISEMEDQANLFSE